MKDQKTGTAEARSFKSLFSDNSPVMIIAETGTSHNGDPLKAAELITAAAEAGADCVKTQIVFADEIIHPKTGEVDLPGGRLRLYDIFKRLERNLDFYLDFRRKTESLGLLFLASPFGLKSLDYLLELDADAIKIASPELNHFPLLQAAAETGRPLLLSTGVSTDVDISRALEITGRANSLLMHCITAYPAPENEYNLRIIPYLSGRFDVPAGLSDHSSDPLLVPAAAAGAGLGTRCIEKHFTLARKGGGLDDPIALEPDNFRRMVNFIRKLEDDESPKDSLYREFGRERVDSVLGNGIKQLAASEKMNYGRTNRSIHAVECLPAGTVLTRENTALLRTEKVLRPGLHPEEWESIIGKKLIRDVDSGQGIVREDIG